MKIEDDLFNEIYWTLRYIKTVGENRTTINIKKMARELVSQINPVINKAYEQGRQSVIEELKEENKKFLQGFNYKKNE